MTKYTIQCSFPEYDTQTVTVEADSVEDACAKATAEAGMNDLWESANHGGDTFVDDIRRHDGPPGCSLPVPFGFTELASHVAGDGPGSALARAVARGDVALPLPGDAGVVAMRIADEQGNPAGEAEAVDARRSMVEWFNSWGADDLFVQSVDLPAEATKPTTVEEDVREAVDTILRARADSATRYVDRMIDAAIGELEPSLWRDAATEPPDDDAQVLLAWKDPTTGDWRIDSGYRSREFWYSDYHGVPHNPAPDRWREMAAPPREVVTDAVEDERAPYVLTGKVELALTLLEGDPDERDDTRSFEVALPVVDNGGGPPSTRLVDVLGAVGRDIPNVEFIRGDKLTIEVADGRDDDYALGFDDGRVGNYPLRDTARYADGHADGRASAAD